MTSDPLLERLGQLAWPAPAADQPEPEPGQLWRAVWSDVVSLVVVLAAPPGRKVAVAAASASDAGDDRSATAETIRGLRPTVWGGVTAEIPLFTLEYRVGDLTPASFERVATLAHGGGTGDWPAIVDDLDDRALIRADSTDRLAALAGADWLPAAGGDDHTSLADAARAAGLSASVVAARLGITPGDARRLLQGRREPTAQETELLEGLVGPTATGVVSYEADLVVELDQPEFRPALRLVAVSEYGGDEAAARRAVAGRMMAMAARHRGPGARNWKALLRNALRQD